MSARVEAALRGDEDATAEQRQAASQFLCWPMNMLDLAKQDDKLPDLVVELAKFIARRERNALAAAERLAPDTAAAVADEREDMAYAKGVNACLLRLYAAGARRDEHDKAWEDCERMARERIDRVLEARAVRKGTT